VITRGHLNKGLESLFEEFAGIFSTETVERFMAASLHALKDSGSATTSDSEYSGSSTSSSPGGLA
jgi:hypothetical protein